MKIYRQQGFTLIELIVFIVIISSIVISTVPFFMQLLLDLTRMREMSQASLLINETVETAKSLCTYGGLITKTSSIANNCPLDAFDTINSLNLPLSETINLPNSSNALISFTRNIIISGAITNGSITTCLETEPYTDQMCKCLFIKIIKNDQVLASFPQQNDPPLFLCREE